MEEKKFFETFPTLHLNKRIEQIFSEAVVTHICMNGQRTCVKIYVRFQRLIGRDIIADVENEIRRQIKPFFGMQVIIKEKFELSSLHTPETILDEYRDSILYELGKDSMIKQQIYKNAEIEIKDDNNIIMSTQGTFVAQRYADEICGAISDMMLNRFGYEVNVVTEYTEVKESRHSKEAEYKLEQMVHEISERAHKNPAHKADEENSTVEPSENTGKPEMSAQKPEKPKQRADGGNNYKSNKEFKRDGSDFRRSVKRSDNPDVIYGRDFDGEAVNLDTVVGEMGEIIFRGQIMNADKRELRSGKVIFMFDITDFTDSISVKMFMMPEQLEEVQKDLKPGTFVRVKGVTTIDRFSGELTIGSVSGIMKSSDFRVKRTDMALEKRVELHCHTKMSELDGVSDVSAIVKQAAGWGHPALAITDHGVVQAFTEAFHTKLDNKDFKIIYGVEAYLVDDLKRIIENPGGQNFDDTYVVFDLETTGLSPVNDRIIEIGAVKMCGGKVTNRFSTFVNPQIPIPFNIESLTGISDSMVENAGTIEEILPDFLLWLRITPDLMSVLSRKKQIQSLAENLNVRSLIRWHFQGHYCRHSVNLRSIMWQRHSVFRHLIIIARWMMQRPAPIFLQH